MDLYSPCLGEVRIILWGVSVVKRYFRSRVMSVDLTPRSAAVVGRRHIISGFTPLSSVQRKYSGSLRQLEANQLRRWLYRILSHLPCRQSAALRIDVVRTTFNVAYHVRRALAYKGRSLQGAHCQHLGLATFRLQRGGGASEERLNYCCVRFFV